MVTQILESVRLERGRVDLRREPLDLVWRGDARGGAVRRARTQGATSRITTDIARGLYVLADPLALDVVVRNLLENAIAAVAPVGGGTHRRSPRGAHGGEIELAVKDSGVGFRPADGAGCSRSSRACTPAAAAATTAPGSGSSSCAG